MFSINTFAVNRLNNAEFVGFFINHSHAIDQAGAENLGLDEGVMSNFSNLHTKLPMQELTTVINGFCYDLRDKLSEDDLDVLSVTFDPDKKNQPPSLRQMRADLLSVSLLRIDTGGLICCLLACYRSVTCGR